MEDKEFRDKVSEVLTCMIELAELDSFPLDGKPTTPGGWIAAVDESYQKLVDAHRDIMGSPDGVNIRPKLQELGLSLIFLGFMSACAVVSLTETVEVLTDKKREELKNASTN